MGGEVSERFKIIGVDCPSCVYAIQKSLAKLKGVKDLRVDIASGEAVVTYDASSVSSSDIYRAVRDAGYDVHKEVLVLAADVEAEEVARLENHIRRIVGVLDCRISLITKSIKVLFNPYATTRSAILTDIGKVCPGVKEVGEELSELRDRKEPALLTQLVSFALGLSSVVYYAIGVLWFEPPMWSSRNLLLGFIATVVLLLNKRTVVSGYRALARRAPTMDSLVALSSTTTYLFSLAVSLNLVSAYDTFFEASAGVLGFVAFGRYLEERLRIKALQNLQKLLEAQQGRVRVIRNGKAEEVDADDVRVGDIVEVKSGEKILVDGVVVDGWGYVDESTFTGEPVPKFKTYRNRDHVLAGTVLVTGYIRVRATRVGKETSLYRIYEAVREAQFSKPSFQRLADRVLGAFTWAVIALSATAFAYWLVVEGSLNMAVVSAAAVLAVACPCPLGIAIPMVVSVASIKAMRLGLLVRDATVFEKMLEVDTALFDKTGTITLGRPEVVGVRIFNGFSDREVLSYVCSVERRSEHLIAKAILRYCEEVGIEFGEPENFEYVPGAGVVGTVQGKRVVVGSQRLLKEFGIGLDPATDLDLGGKGLTVVLVAVDSRLAGLIEISDRPREEAAETLDFLKSRGVKVFLVSGDHVGTARSVAKAVGIEVENVYAGLGPEDKAELLENIQRRGGRKAMFVGDGLNDAIALGKAFIGIAMGSGADISKEVGDVVIVNNRLDAIVKLYRLCEKVRRKALANLAWSFLYNATLIPIAMGILYKHLGIVLRPEFGAIAMILSDISVVLNSITLLNAKIE